MRLLLKKKFCIGCRNCEIVCSLNRTGDINPERAAIRISKYIREGIHRPVVCIQCQKKPCLHSCPTKAIKLDPGLGIAIIDEDLCDGCGACVKACPLNAIFLDPANKKAIKCDLCGGEPQCINFCRALWHQQGKALNLGS